MAKKIRFLQRHNFRQKSNVVVNVQLEIKRYAYKWLHLIPNFAHKTIYIKYLNTLNSRIVKCSYRVFIVFDSSVSDVLSLLGVPVSSEMFKGQVEQVASFDKCSWVTQVTKLW